MKQKILRILVFACSFLVGCMFSFDTQISVWPEIPDLKVEKETRIVCSLGPKRTDGRDSCVCKVAEEH